LPPACASTSARSTRLERVVVAIQGERECLTHLDIVEGRFEYVEVEGTTRKLRYLRVLPFEHRVVVDDVDDR
jgi:hypothetical protein